jgi:hypothetical protein
MMGPKSKPIVYAAPREDEAELRAALAEEPLDAEASEAYLKWLESGGQGPCPVPRSDNQS